MRALFTLSTDRLRLTWSGPPSSREGDAPLVARPVEAPVVRLDPGAGLEAPVWLEEETDYPVLLQSLDGTPVALEHRDPVVVAGLVSADGGRVLHGRVRFGSQAGRSTFAVRSGARVETVVGVSVLPVKLGEGEVASMRAEVEAAAAGLSVAALRPTTLADAGRSAEPSPPVWLAALRDSVDDLTRAVREIDRRPALETVRTVAETRSGTVRHPTSETRRAARRRGLEAPTLPARPPRSTADTPAHRWLAAGLEVVGRRLRALAREEGGRRSTARRRVLLAELRDLEARVEALRSAAVLRGLGARVPSVPPLVLRRRPAYASAFEALRRIDRGLALREGGLDVATQDLAVLFETWTALAVVGAVARALGAAPPARPFGVDLVGADVRLRRGRRHAVRLGGRGLEAEVAYEPRFPAPPGLLVQRPDLMLTVRRGPETRRVVLDAKYRRDDSAGYRRRHGAAGPPEDALNTLHRYRDAIPGEVAVAAALFPGRPGDPFYLSRLWTSLEALGVGAVPVAPGGLEALDRFIAALVRA